MLSIETKNLSKIYAPGRGTHDVTLEVEAGEVFGFLGPNGAGKSTTIRMLLGFLRPTAGSGKVLGRDIVRESLAIRARTGYLPGDVRLYPHMKGSEVIELALASRGKKDSGRVKMLQDRLDIDLSVRVKQCSKGMRQKIGIIAALAYDPELIMLDEPTTGLDPLVQQVFIDLLKEEAARGKTVFFSSHYMSEVEALCNRVAIIRAGRLVAVNHIETLRANRLKRVTARFEGEPISAEEIPEARDVRVDGNRLSLQVKGDLRPLLGQLAKSSVTDLRIEDPSLEEILLEFYVKEGGGQE